MLSLPLKYISLSSRLFSVSATPHRELPRPPLRRQYDLVGHWDSQQSLVDELESNVVHLDVDGRQRGTVVLNKPYGLPLNKQDNCPYYLKESLKELAKRLQLDQKLILVKAPERYNSGVTLLATTPEDANHLRHCLNRSRHKMALQHRYLVLTNHFPRQSKVTEVVDMLKKQVSQRDPVFGKKVLEPVFTRNLKSKTFISKGKEGCVRFQVHSEINQRSKAGPASLTSLHIQSDRNNFILAYMSDLLSPVLGDPFFSYRAKIIMGTMTKISHTQSPLDTQQQLPSWLLDRLGLSQGQEHRIPRHIHCFRTTLFGYKGKENEINLFAPPPNYFMDTAKALEIAVDLEALMDSDAPKIYSDLKKKEAEDKKLEDERPQVTHRGETIDV